MLGTLGLLGVLATVTILVIEAAGTPTGYVPASAGGWPRWLSGPFHGLGGRLGGGGFQTLMLAMCASYLLVLMGARRLPMSAVLTTIIAVHLVLLLGPPLISRDVFGYLTFARMGALHGLDPYTHFPAAIHSDGVYSYIGWPYQHSPYGPLFTLASYALVPLGIAGGLWALKALAVLASLVAVRLTSRAGEHMGNSASYTAAFLGLNPVLLVFAVGGAHNDTLLIALLALALVMSAGSSPRLRRAAAALVAGVGVKVTAGVLIPFLLLSPLSIGTRARLLTATAIGLVVVLAIGIVGFGPHALGFLGAIGEQQHLVATHSIPAETARLFSLDGTPAWWRHLYVLAFVAVMIYAAWRTATGTDWRVAAGWSTLALLVCTAWFLPWYAVWALPLAAVSGDRRLRGAALVLCAYSVLIHLPLADPLLSPRR
jgi:alpha-1,6-mannosyltransferase